MLFFIDGTSAAKSLQSCPTLCDPIEGSPPGSAIPGILQARTVEWVAFSFSKKVLLMIKIALSYHIPQWDQLFNSYKKA